jgi:hypothetical protein
MMPINTPQYAHDVLVREFGLTSIVMTSINDQVAQTENTFQLSLVANHWNASYLPRTHDFERIVDIICGSASRDLAGHRLLGYKLERPAVPSADRHADIAVRKNTQHFPVRIDHGQRSAAISPQFFRDCSEVSARTA